MEMKKLTLALSLAAILPVAHQASADPTFMVGIAYNFGGTVGFTAKALSDNEPDMAVGAIGASYFPWSKTDKLGFDVGAGYLTDNTVITLGYDFLGQKPQASVGYAETDEDDGHVFIPPAPPVNTPPPPPENPV